MLKFDEKKFIDNLKGALALRGKINDLVDKFQEEAFKNICWLGIGGTWASAMQAYVHMKERSSIEVFVENAAEYLVTGNKRLGEKTLVIISSVTGSTEEMVKAVEKVKKSGAKVLGFIDRESASLASQVDWCISYPMNEQLKFFMVADRLMYNNGEFPEYEDLYNNLEEYLPQALVEVSRKAESFGIDFAMKHHADDMHYFIGAGNQYGATYSYAMCYWEEQHWIRTKSISSGEFFHGMLEVIDKNSNVTVFIGEDSQRPLSERVAKFLPRICSRYNIIDTRDYELRGIKEEYRGYISHLVMRQICDRIDRYIEKINCHPMEIRRYYRVLDY